MDDDGGSGEGSPSPRKIPSSGPQADAGPEAGAESTRDLLEDAVSGEFQSGEQTPDERTPDAGPEADAGSAFDLLEDTVSAEFQPGERTPLASSDTPKHGFGDTPVYQPNTPVQCQTPIRTPNRRDSDVSLGSSSEEEEDDQDPNVSYHNPEPHSEIKKDLIEADNIGDTVFSKHWLFTTLMNLIQVVDRHTEGKDSPSGNEAGIDIEDSLQNELCKLWDMSMNSEVVAFLLEYKAIELFTGVVAKSKAPRATEISVGILGNMACTEEAAVKMAEHQKLIDLMLILLNDSDTPTLVEATRLISSSIAHVSARQPWLTAIKQDSTVLTNLLFIISSSTNGDLLHNTAELLDKIMDVDEGLCETFSTEDLVQGVLEASKQIGIHPCETLDSLFHILQLVSTVQNGVESLVNLAEAVSVLLLEYLTQKCGDEIIGVEGRENSFASVFSVLNVIFASWELRDKLIVQDYQIMRCLLKVLEAVYPKLHKEENSYKSRRRTVSITSNSPQRMSTDHRDDEASSESGIVGEQVGTDTQSSNSDNTSSSQDGYDETIMTMLYEVLQGFAVDIVTALRQTVPVSNGEMDSQDKMPDSPAKTLVYLDSSCIRERIYYLTFMLQEVNSDPKESQNASEEDPKESRNTSEDDPKESQNALEEESSDLTPVSILQNIAEECHLDRLSRILKDALTT